MGGRNANPLGAHGHSQRMDKGTLVLRNSPAPGPTGNSSQQSHNVTRRVLVFDSEYLNRLFRSTAHAVFLARTVAAVPMRSSPNDAVGVATIIRVMPNRWLPQEVETPDEEVVNAAILTGEDEYGSLFMQELDERGVAGAVRFLEDLEAQRENALNKVRQVFQSAGAHNQNASEAHENIVNTLTVVKCASTIVVAGLSLPVIVAGAAGVGIAAGSSWAAFGLSTSYSVTLSVIKNWNQANSADLVMIASQKAANKAAAKGTKEVAKSMGKIYQQEGEGIASAGRRIDWLTKRVEQIGRGRDVRRLSDAKAALKEVRNAGRLATALKFVPYLFFAWSTYDALDNARHEWQ